MKKLITAALSMLLVLGNVQPVQAAASSIYEILVLMNLLTYDSDNTISETTPISRAEFAKALYLLAGYGTTAANSYTSPFTDVSYSNQYAGYIKTVASLGYMSGYAKGYFKPDQTITTDEAIKSLLLILGYSANEIAGSDLLYQTARIKGLLDNTALNVNQPLTKGDYAQLIYNALSAALKSSNQTLAQSLGYTLRSDSLSLSDVIDVNAVGPIALTGSASASDFGLTSPTTYLNGVEKAYQCVRVMLCIILLKQINYGYTAIMHMARLPKSALIWKMLPPLLPAVITLVPPMLSRNYLPPISCESDIR